MLYIKAGTFIYICLTVSIARMLAASMQCWRMVRALRSHGRCWLVSSDEILPPYASRSRTSSVNGQRPLCTLYIVKHSLYSILERTGSQCSSRRWGRMRNATPVLPFKTRRPTRRHYFLRLNFWPFSFFTHTSTMRAKINPDPTCIQCPRSVGPRQSFATMYTVWEN